MTLISQPHPNDKRFVDITGKEFGRLKVVSYAGKINGQHMWNCKCKCGNEKIVSRTNLPNQESCGCYRSELLKEKNTTHGLSKNPLYTVYRDLLRRCYDPKRKDYRFYGGLGVRVCQGWKTDFKNFYADANPRPENEGKSEYSIDRIDVSGNYSCGHCEECISNGWTKNWRWATQSEQNLNKHNTVYLEFKGEKKPLYEWAKIFDIPPRRLYFRIRRGVPAERALTHGKLEDRVRRKTPTPSYPPQPSTSSSSHHSDESPICVSVPNHLEVLEQPPLQHNPEPSNQQRRHPKQLQP